ncbi:hypothetical protein L2E82_22837 [Cichorium intybus]|uniref:Uncharacterized protein n=1 Tax=Cichorium intybus TaxID=13427 RepID=A0ACB9DZ58_CICIN|nr:hypothetical protein L2E82_22837 [Cichorium intybus]
MRILVRFSLMAGLPCGMEQAGSTKLAISSRSAKCLHRKKSSTENFGLQNSNTFKSENSPPQTKILKNKENSNQNQIVLKIQKNLLTNKVNQGQTKSISEINSKKLHPGFYGNGLSMLTRLEGHTKAITGIALPSGSNKLFCGSKDKSLRCRVVVDIDDECGTLVNEGPWIFVGLRDMIKAWNLNTQHEFIIRGSGGQVNANYCV